MRVAFCFYCNTVERSFRKDAVYCNKCGQKLRVVNVDIVYDPREEQHLNTNGTLQLKELE